MCHGQSKQSKTLGFPRYTCSFPTLFHLGKWSLHPVVRADPPFPCTHTSCERVLSVQPQNYSSNLSTSLYFRGHSPCPSHHHFSAEGSQSPLHWSSYFLSFLCSSTLLTIPKDPLKKGQIVLCSYFKPSVASLGVKSSQIPHRGLQDPTWFGCCYLSCCLPPLLLARYSPCWPPFCSSNMPCYFSPGAFAFDVPSAWNVLHGSCHGWFLLFLQVSTQTLLEHLSKMVFPRPSWSHRPSSPCHNL